MLGRCWSTGEGRARVLHTPLRSGQRLRERSARSALPASSRRMQPDRAPGCPVALLPPVPAPGSCGKGRPGCSPAPPPAPRRGRWEKSGEVCEGRWQRPARGTGGLCSAVAHPKTSLEPGGREERTESCALAERAEPRCCASAAKHGCCLPGKVTPLILITPGSAQPCRADLTASGSVSPTS